MFNFIFDQNKIFTFRKVISIKVWLYSDFSITFSVVMLYIHICSSVICLKSPNIVHENYVHPPGGWIYYFCFFRRPMSDVRRPASGVRCPASRMVSAHLKEKY